MLFSLLFSAEVIFGTGGIRGHLRVFNFMDLLQLILCFFWNFAIPITIIMILFGAFYFLTSGGNPEKIGKGKSIIATTFVGFIIFLGIIGFTGICTKIPPKINPMASIDAYPQTILYGGDIKLTWSARDAHSCVVTAGDQLGFNTYDKTLGDTTITGLTSGPTSVIETFAIKCEGDEGKKAFASVEVTILSYDITAIPPHLPPGAPADPLPTGPHEPIQLPGGGDDGTATVPSPPAVITPPPITLPPPGTGSDFIVSPTQLMFTGTVGPPASLIPSQSFNIENTGTSDLKWTATEHTVFLAICPHLQPTIGGILGVGENIDVIVDPTNCPQVGDWTGIITVNFPDLQESVEISVERKCRLITPAEPILLVAPITITDSIERGSGDIEIDYIFMINTGVGDLNWSYSTNKNWISLSPDGSTDESLSGLDIEIIRVSVNRTGLQQGIHNGEITFYGHCSATNIEVTDSPITVNIELTVFLPNIYLTYNLFSTREEFFGGRIGGRAGANAKCNVDLDKPLNCDGPAWAFMSVSAIDEVRDMLPGGEGGSYVNNRFAPWFFRDYTHPGILAANNWADLLDGSVINRPMDGGFDSGLLGYGANHWTGTDGSDGSVAAYTCGGWTEAFPDPSGGISGVTNSTGKRWLGGPVAGSWIPTNCIAIPFDLPLLCACGSTSPPPLIHVNKSDFMIWANDQFWQSNVLWSTPATIIITNFSNQQLAWDSSSSETFIRTYPLQGSLNPGQAITVTVQGLSGNTLNPPVILPGKYYESVTITAGNQQITIPITLRIIEF